MPGKPAAKLQSQPDETWSQLHKRLIDVSFDYTEILSQKVADFIETKATASHTCMGYTVVSLIAVTAFLISLGATIQTTPGMNVKPNLFTLLIGPPSTGKSQALKIGAINPLDTLIEYEEENFLLEKVSPSGLSAFLAKHRKCFILSTEMADVFNNLLKQTDDTRFSTSTLCQLFSSERITIDFATQARRTIPANTPFALLGGIQVKPVVLLTNQLAQQGSGLLDRMLFCAPSCFPPSMTEVQTAVSKLEGAKFATDFNLFLQTVHEQHPIPAEDEEPIIYTFQPEALIHLQELHSNFNTELRNALAEGQPP